mgnify:CR=1 FL=1
MWKKPIGSADQNLLPCYLALISYFVAYMAAKMLVICCIVCVEIVFQKSFQLVG